VLDTGAALTTLVPSVAASIGCGLASAIRPTVMRTAAAVEHGYLVQLVELSSLGVTVARIHVNVAELGYGVDGILGMNFSSTSTSKFAPRSAASSSSGSRLEIGSDRSMHGCVGELRRRV
jgi:predicted aspartyl protease